MAVSRFASWFSPAAGNASRWASAISSLLIVVAVPIIALSLYFIVLAFSNAADQSGSYLAYGLLVYMITLATGLVSLGLGILLKIAAEAIFLGMDIEQNTRGNAD